MKLLFINPNSSAGMTEAIVATARAAVPHAEVIGWTNADGPPAIQGAADGEAAVPGLLAMVPAAKEAGVDVLIIGCFDDTGLDAVRDSADFPVIGLGQASFHAAALWGGRFAVLTTLPISIPVIEENLIGTGFGAESLGVFASDLPVLAVDEGGAHVIDRLTQRIGLIDNQGASSVILGCAGMTRHATRLQRDAGIRLIDPVRAAACFAEALIKSAA